MNMTKSKYIKSFKDKLTAIFYCMVAIWVPDVFCNFYFDKNYKNVHKGAFTLANFACDFALSLHVLLNKNDLFSLLNVQASVKSRAKSRQCKCTLSQQPQRLEKKYAQIWHA